MTPPNPPQGSWSTSYHTVEAALAMASSGDEVWVAAGTYYTPYPGGLEVPPGVKLYGGFEGTETQLSQRVRGQNETVLDGGGGGYVVVMLLDTSGESTLDSFTIRNAAVGACSAFGDTYVTVSNNVITDNYYCGIFEECCSAAVFGNRIMGSGVGFWGSTSYCEVHDNIFENNDCGAISTDDVDSSSFINNTIVKNDYGIYVQSHLVIVNNIVAFQAGPGIVGYEEATPTLLNNCVYGNGDDEDYVGVSPGDNSISADPQFIDFGNGDYHITYGSPCHDSGEDSYVCGLTDFDEKPRTSGACADIGAYETADTTDPTLSVVTPSAEDEWHIAPNAANLVITGTALDSESGIASVQVDTGSGPSAATYNPGSHEWTYTWSSPSNATVTVTATDSAGNVATLQADVSVVGVIYVDAMQPNDQGSGDSWVTAKKTVIAGLNDATGATDIWVADGTYTGCITMKSNVRLYGGFAGGATGERCREQRNWAANPTVLDGNDSGSVVTINSVSGCVVDGFTIQHGIGTHLDDFRYGGGLFCSDAAAVVANSIVRDNTSLDGAGLYASSPSYPGSGPSDLNLVGNVFVSNATQYGAGIVHLDSVQGEVANNTIIGNDGTGLSLSIPAAVSLAVANNIISHNEHGGLSKDGQGSPSFSSNLIHGNDSFDYYEMSIPATDLVIGSGADIGMPGIDSGDWHISGNSPCVDAGATVSVTPERDIDGDARPYGAGLDIGADENTDCLRYTMTPVLRCVPMYTEATINITATDMTAGQPAGGIHIDISVDAGEITSVTRNGTPIELDPDTTTSYAETAADGTAQVTITRADQGYIQVSASVSACGTQIDRMPRIWFYDPAEHNVGFVHGLCFQATEYHEPANDIEAYLLRVPAADPDVHYSRIPSAPPITIDDSINTLFLAWPTRPLQTDELITLSSFLHSGGHKRLVLVGEFSEGWWEYNQRLNLIGQHLQLHTRFHDDPWGVGEGPWYYDTGIDCLRLCDVNHNHYLMAGVNYLWDADTDRLLGWQSYAQPLADTYQASGTPWIVEEQFGGGVSVVLIHDASIFTPEYNLPPDDADKNLKFAHNLCTLFPQ